MLESIEGIEHAIKGKTFTDYENEWVLRHALQRGIEIISEASRAIPADVKHARPELPRERMHAIGNILRHGYYRLSDRIIWGVVVDELPRLKDALVFLRDNIPDQRP